MSDEFSVNVPGLRSAGTSMQQLGARLDGRQESLKSQVAGSSAIWGSDEEGSVFEGGYLEVTARLGELLGGLAEAFDTVGVNLGVSADNIAAADDATREQIHGIQQRLGRP
ncbi:hypothetical protein [Actinomadura livida]|uniref:Uncharacterized protein YukE n=1 Tax=Actinomadura livida TaxID=79909 RepID=A0A7W7N0R6_9ACTN|nr:MULTISPECIES: hypothetical protein [Actinomadura]MBB4777364.1 uncharacterized protein YukE [Actinomadura catellatispora]GGU19748.1 hypothetical protein GCM10010208_50810 [Actinomadura livida]